MYLSISANANGISELLIQPQFDAESDESNTHLPLINAKNFGGDAAKYYH